MSALLAEEAGETIARAVITIPRARAVGRTGQQRTIIALVTRIAFAEIVRALALVVAVVWTGSDGTVRTREPVVTETRAVIARPVVGAIARTHSQRAVVPGEPWHTLALKMWETIAIARTVVGTRPHTAVRAGIALVTVAGPVVALAVPFAVIHTALEAAIVALPSVLARAVEVDAFPVPMAVVRAGALCALWPTEADLAIARAVVAVAMGGTVPWTTLEPAVVAGEPFIAVTPVVLAHTIPGTLVWASCN